MVERRLWAERDDYAEQLGWPELVDAVAAARRRLPPAERADAAVLARNYGEAGAVDLLGPRRGLPPAVSGHLSYRYWPPSDGDARTLVTVGYTPAELARWCESVRPAGVVDNRAGVDNEERGVPITLCLLRGTLAEHWPDLRRR
jgi:hypothetical protein